jgi:sialate O-acetylesterase
MLRWSLALLSMLVPVAAHGDVTLPAIFSDHMVLQADREVAVWGWADPGEEVQVSISGASASAKAGESGKWSLKIKTGKSDAPVEMTVRGKNSLTIRDVLLGEVWLCSGQSNMAMTVNRCKDFEQDAAAADFPQIRMFKENSGSATQPREKAKGVWEVCSPKTVGGFSATAYFFGREVHKSLGVPVGLINSSVGGTPVEAWTSWDAQKDKAELKPLFAKWDRDAETWNPETAQAKYQEQLAAWKTAAAKAKAEGKQAARQPQKPVNPRLNTHHPAVLFNGKIAPLVPYTIRGFLWYQGESNAGGMMAQNYGLQLRTLVEDWRALWGEELPFAWVQLPNFRAAVPSPVQETGWTTVREQMTKTLALPRTGMAITLDVGEANDIHPKDKQTVGQRLAQWALSDVYGKKEIVPSGPLYSKHTISDGKVTIEFRYADGGLSATDGKLTGFAIAGADKMWLDAKAEIQGDRVVVSHPDVKEPFAVRYAWKENPAASLRGSSGIPAAPFRTDDWPVVAVRPAQRRAR